MPYKIHRRLNDDSGVSLVEVLFSLVLFSIMGLGLAYSTITGYHTRARNLASTTALQIGLETLEDLGAMDPDVLDDSMDYTGQEITRNNLTFYRTLNIEIETDRTRTAFVSIDHEKFGINVDLTNSFALWDRR